MRDRSKWWIAAAACAVAAASWQDAFAGNVAASIPASSVQYFSVKIDYQNRLHIGAGVVGALIDDITYMVEPEPLAPAARTAMFTWGDIIGWEDVGYVGSWGVFGNRQMYWGHQTIPPTGHYLLWADVQHWANAYGYHIGLQVVETSLSWQFPMQPFDGVCHTFYGQMLGREVQLNNLQQSNNPPFQGMGVGVGVSVAVTQSSESRHYQTPHVIWQNPADPKTVAIVPAPPSGAYPSVRVFIKGRTVSEVADMPVLSPHIAVGP